jgi:hypothetical protein
LLSGGSSPVSLSSNIFDTIGNAPERKDKPEFSSVPFPNAMDGKDHALKAHRLE